MTFDAIIVGSGPAGLTAGMYLGRDRREMLFLEKESIGGDLVNRHQIRNYPGFPDGISGTDFRSKLLGDVDQYDPAVEQTEVTEVEFGDQHVVKTDSDDFQAETVIIAAGCRSQELDVPGAEEFRGRGIFSCATCDGPLYQDEKVAVAGGGNEAVMDALFLTNHASEVIVIEERPQLPADEELRTEAAENSEITILGNTAIKEVTGEDGLLESLQLADTRDGTERVERVDGLNVHVGVTPNTEFLANSVSLDEGNQIIVDERMETDIAGVFAAGDIRQSSPRTVASAVGDGAAAANSAIEYLEKTEIS